MRIRQPGMLPEKIAIAVAVTMAAIAGIGAMKNVTGTSKAVAMVAVSPGTAPTNSPNNDAISITKMLYGSNTSANACAQAWLIGPPRLRQSPCPVLQEAPRQRHPQQLVEGVVNHQGDRQRERKIVAESHAEDREQNGKVDRAGEDEAEPVDQQNVEDVDADDEGEGEQVPRRAHPLAAD